MRELLTLNYSLHPQSPPCFFMGRGFLWFWNSGQGNWLDQEMPKGFSVYGGGGKGGSENSAAG